MKRYHFIYNITLMTFMAISLTSCDDFLTIYPQDRIVEENFWDSKNDLDGVRYAAYQQLGGQIDNFIVWGDLRSDAYSINPVTKSSKRDYFKKIFEGKLDSTMAEADWGGVYTGINYCNKVLQHGQEVMEKDFQFSSTEWTQMRAEMITLRSLFYFYLIRSFKDVPYSNEVINTDEDVRIFSSINQLTILDDLIKDVESVQGQGVSRYASKLDTKGLITNASMYAILTDMYLWRSALREGRGMTASLWQDDAQKVIEYGQKCLDALERQEEQSQTGTLAARTKTDKFNSNVENGELLVNDKLASTWGTPNTIIDSYTAIFNTQNSQESIFEFQYSMSDNRTNGVVGKYWGKDDYTLFSVNDAAFKKALGGEDLTTTQDSRKLYSCQDKVKDAKTGDPFYMLKWSRCSFNTSQTLLSPNNYSNWIFYRKTDILLMMAEAHAVLSAAKNDAEVVACKAIVNAIHKRSDVNQLKDHPGSSAATDKASCIKLVMNERMLELIGEGKRWFDLVRYAERIGGGLGADPRETEYMNGSEGVMAMINDFLAEGNDGYKDAWQTRFVNRYGLYMPIYYKERSANHYQVQQNPVWDRDKASQQ